MTITTSTAADKPGLLHVAESCGLFQTEELDELGGMVDAFLAGGLEGHHWLSLKEEGEIKAAAYYAPETFADGV